MAQTEQEKDLRERLFGAANRINAIADFGDKVAEGSVNVSEGCFISEKLALLDRMDVVIAELEKLSRRS